MIYFYIFLAGGIAMILLILRYDAQQRKRVKTVVRTNKQIPALLMQKSADQKLNKLIQVLNSMGSPMANEKMASSQMDIPAADLDAARKDIVGKLGDLQRGYEKRYISLQEYSARLGDLVIQVTELKECFDQYSLIREREKAPRSKFDI
jgi:hypothetical protein